MTSVRGFPTIFPPPRGLLRRNVTPASGYKAELLRLQAELERLALLHEEGVLDDNAYWQERKAIVKQMPQPPDRPGRWQYFLSAVVLGWIGLLVQYLVRNKGQWFGAKLNLALLALYWLGIVVFVFALLFT